MFLKKLISILIVCICISSFSFADTALPPTGNEIIYCPLSFRIGYIPTGDNVFNNDISVIFTDIATDKTYQFLLEANEGYNATNTYTILANTTYKVNLLYKGSDQYRVVNADGTEITSYAATESGLILNWSIKDIDNNLIKPNSLVESPNQIDLNNDVLKSYFDTTSFMISDNEYRMFLENWSNEIYKKSFLSVEGLSETLWDSMSLYERASYSILFIYPKLCIQGGYGNEYAKDRATFLDNLKIIKQGLNNLPNNEIVFDAIVEVWNWHYDNWQNSNIVLNPFSNTKFESDVKLKIENEIINLPNEQLTLVGDAETVRKNLAKPVTFYNIFKKNIVTIIIMLVSLISLGVIIYRNKKNNVYEED